MASVLCLSFLGTKDAIYIWVLSCLMNIFSSPLFPDGYIWVNQYIPLRGLVIYAEGIGSGIAGVIFMCLNGWLFTNVSPQAIFYILMFNQAALCIQIVIMQISVSRYDTRFTET